MGISITFTDLTPGQVDYLMNAYSVIAHEPIVDRDDPQSMSQVAHQSEYDAARQFVEQAAPPIVAPAAPGIQIPQPALSSAIEIDAEGVPWDGRYHSSTKSKTVKGIWSLRKGVNKDPALAAAAEAYRAQHRRGGAPVPSPAETLPPATLQYPAGVTMPQAPQPQIVAMPVAPDYGNWYLVLAAANQAGRLTDQVMTHINGQSGVTDIQEYLTNDRARAISYPMLQQLVA